MSEISESATNVSLGVSATSSVTVATGVLGTVNTYAPLIGIALSCTSIFLATVFFFANRKQRARELALKEEELRHRIREEVLQEILQREG